MVQILSEPLNFSKFSRSASVTVTIIDEDGSEILPVLSVRTVI